MQIAIGKGVHKCLTPKGLNEYGNVSYQGRRPVTGRAFDGWQFKRFSVKY